MVYLTDGWYWITGRHVKYQATGGATVGEEWTAGIYFENGTATKASLTLHWLLGMSLGKVAALGRQKGWNMVKLKGDGNG